MNPRLGDLNVMKGAERVPPWQSRFKGWFVCPVNRSLNDLEMKEKEDTKKGGFVVHVSFRSPL